MEVFIGNSSNGGFSIAMFDKQRVTIWFDRPNIFCRLLDMITNDKGSYTLQFYFGDESRQLNDKALCCSFPGYNDLATYSIL
jgi:hypothetical protein